MYHHLVFILLFYWVVSHPTFYNISGTNIDCSNAPPVYSYHIHVLWNQVDTNKTVVGLALREKFMEAFHLKDGQPCDSDNTTHPTAFCMFPTMMEGMGPFPVANWIVLVTSDWLGDTVAWIQMNHGDFDVLIHPNTGCEVHDHTVYAIWIGNKWPLNLRSLHIDCPGCTTFDPPSIGTKLMLQNTYQSCGLSLPKPGELFLLPSWDAFCSPTCQQWVVDLEQMGTGYPYICDYFDQPALDMCISHTSSLDLLRQWSYVCSYFINH